MTYLIIAFGILFIIITYLLFRVSARENELRDAYFILGYYKLRFGEVSIEDVVNRVGLPQEYKDMPK